MVKKRSSRQTHKTSSSNKAVQYRWTGSDFIALVCFFLSGVTGLIYEICWIRKSSLFFGATSFAVSTVIATFFLGLAFGSWYFGKQSTRDINPLKWCGKLEIGIGILGLLSPTFFSLGEKIYSQFYPSLMENFAALTSLRALVIFILIFPITTCMGGTLPLFCRQYVTRDDKIVKPVGFLYGINTLGAMIGCLLCGIYLIPNIGVNVSIWSCGVINLCLGLVILKLPIAQDTWQQTMARINDDVHEPAKQSAIISLLFFMSGFVILGYEILWTRFLSLLIHNTVYTYTITLAAILAGIVIGSVIIALFGDRLKRLAIHFGLLQVLLGSVVLTLILQPVEFWQAKIHPESGMKSMGIFFLLFLIPSVLSGMSFPLAIRMVLNQPALSGVRVGRMTAFNTAGGVLGSLVMGFYFIPQLGQQVSLLVMSGLSIAIGILCWLALDSFKKLFIKCVCVSIAVVIWFALPKALPIQIPKDYLAVDGNVVDYHEGINSIMAVMESQSEKHLTIDRLWQGSEGKNQQITAAHIPMLFTKAPKSVCVVGMGVGQTASRFLMYDIESLDCVDIESKLYPFVDKHFESDWMRDSRTRLMVDDGRNYLANIDKEYDLISLELGQVFRPGVAAFYTVDFYQQTKDRLKPNGWVCQFVPISILDPEEFHNLIASFIHVFPNSTLWYNMTEMLLIGSLDQSVKLSSSQIKTVFGNPKVKEDLNYSYWGGPDQWLSKQENLLSSFLCGPETLKKLSLNAALFGDDKPTFEYSTARKQRSDENKIVDILQANLDSINTILSEPLAPKTLSEVDQLRLGNLNDTRARSYLLFANVSASSPIELKQAQVNSLQQAHRLNPKNVLISVDLGKAYLLLNQPLNAVDYFENAVRIDPQHAPGHYQLGVCYSKLNRQDDALRHFELAAKTTIYENPDIHARLGIAYHMKGVQDKAQQQLEKTLSIDPTYYKVRIVLSNIFALRGNFDGARRQLDAAMRTKPNDAELHFYLSDLFNKQGKRSEAIQESKIALSLAQQANDQMMINRIQAQLFSYSAK